VQTSVCTFSYLKSIRITLNDVVSHVGLTNIESAETSNNGNIRVNNDGVLTVRNLELLVTDRIVESETENSFSTESKGKSLYRVLVLKNDVDGKMSIGVIEVGYGEGFMTEKIGVVAMRGKVTVGEYPVKLAFIHDKVLL
jgi:hypothetical protein